MKIALLGSIPKGDDVRQGWVDWKTAYTRAIRRRIPDAEFLHGDGISDNAGAELVVGHDLSQIQQSDICVVDGSRKVGAGTAQEIVVAKYLRKPVVTVIPKNSHHRKTNIVFHGVKMDGFILF
jgi:nucleoside 2-deoxyribosyltransferase